MFKNIKTAQMLEQERYEAEAEKVRAERDRLLKETDYLMMPDYPIADKTALQTYRQALRDITEQTGFPFNTTFPEMPEAY
ncbi:MAG: hypothetical protein C0602_12755 [Denitrovibrio sp.]|nr:MAG: hypothetical protein C0602_12755 [Denitrovibrio sp.]